jgi:protein-S-isoprenylcysteine O-methyltransferase Ste14
MLGFISSVISIIIGLAYSVDVVVNGLGSAALLIALPYVVSNCAASLMIALSLFSKPIKADETWSMFFISLLASNLFAVLYVSGFLLVNPHLNVPVSIAGQLLTLALVPFYTMGVVALGKQMTVMPEARKLVTRGPYSVSRHPLYLTYIVWFALQIAIAQTVAVAVAAVIASALMVVRARREEEILASAFPSEYTEYSERVGWLGRWSPNFATRRVD